MSIKLQIANRARGLLRATPIADLETDPSVGGLANEILSCRDEVLSLHPWNCATDMEAPSLLTSAGVDPRFPCEWQEPPNTLRIWDVLDLKQDEWRRAKGKIKTKAISLCRATITTRVDWETLDPLVAGLIGHRLAMYMAMTVTETVEAENRLRVAWPDMLSEARRLDGREGAASGFTIESSWVQEIMAS